MQVFHLRRCNVLFNKAQVAHFDFLVNSTKKSPKPKQPNINKNMASKFN